MYIFEDNKESPISRLLSVKEECKFAGRNTNIPNMVHQSGKDSICLVDVPLDNLKLISYFKFLLSEFHDSDIQLVPIPCIEYFALLCIHRNQIEKLPRDFIETALYLSYGIGVSHKRYTDKTFERYCKRILSSRKNRCLINKCSIKFGEFYYMDCYEGHGLCGTSRGITVQEKS